jgi:hypothetical protein
VNRRCSAGFHQRSLRRLISKPGGDRIEASVKASFQRGEAERRAGRGMALFVRFVVILSVGAGAVALGGGRGGTGRPPQRGRYRRERRARHHEALAAWCRVPSEHVPARRSRAATRRPVGGCAIPERPVQVCAAATSMPRSSAPTARRRTCRESPSHPARRIGTAASAPGPCRAKRSTTSSPGEASCSASSPSTSEGKTVVACLESGFAIQPKFPPADTFPTFLLHAQRLLSALSFPS